MEVIFTRDFTTSFPFAQTRCVTVRGLRNSDSWDDVEVQIRDLEIGTAGVSPLDEDDPLISSWHEAYRAFGTNPRRTRPSVDALHRRWSKQGRLPRINGAVDAYNLTSLKYGVPAGAFDLDQLKGVVEVRFGREGDKFTPLGEPDKVEEPRPGETVYAEEDVVLTRHWNHRDSHLTRVTNDTTAAVFVLERASDAVNTSVLEAAQEHLFSLLEQHCDDLSTAVLSAEHPRALL